MMSVGYTEIGIIAALCFSLGMVSIGVALGLVWLSQRRRKEQPRGPD